MSRIIRGVPEPQRDAALAPAPKAPAPNLIINMDRFKKNLTKCISFIHIDNNYNHGKPLLKKSEP
jgi:hypothetical protein